MWSVNYVLSTAGVVTKLMGVSDVARCVPMGVVTKLVSIYVSKAGSALTVSSKRVTSVSLDNNLLKVVEKIKFKTRISISAIVEMALIDFIGADQDVSEEMEQMVVDRYYKYLSSQGGGI